MKAETKVRLKMVGRKIGNFIKDWGLPIFGGLTIGAAWNGYVTSNRVDAEVRNLKKVVDNNAHCQMHDRETMLELERQQNLLFEKALKETAGEAE